MALQFSRLAGISILAAALTVCLSACSEEGTPEGWTSKAEVKKQLPAARKAVEVPAGWKWHDEVAGGNDDIYEDGTAESMVLDETMCAWSQEAIKATKEGKQNTVDASLAQLKKLRSLPAYKRNDPSYRQLVESVQDKAELGEMSGLTLYVEKNCKAYL